ncbi:acyltransferase family protein [Tardiphaga sp.]|uniref:acyltransferase family protein n=1 Tax=Tardiphaga sp. TaxID=1926292 RepID=UPI00352B6D73
MSVSGGNELAFHNAVGPKPYIRTHNAIRGCAAIGVFCYHLQLEKTYRIPLGLIAPLVTRGYVWVDLFFILSGFVMSLTYQQALSYADGRSFRAFISARIARIFPLHLFALGYLAALIIGVEAIASIAGRQPHWAALTGHDFHNLGLQAALVQIWDAKATMSWNIPSWSLSAEMHVYLVLPFIAVALRMAPRLTLAVLALVVSAIYAGLLIHYRSLDILTPVALLRCFAGFTLGVIIQQHRRALAGLSDRSLTVMQGMAATATVAILLSPLHDVWVILPFALLVAATSPDRGFLCRLLAGGWQQRLGDTSYSIYLLNFPVLITAGTIWPKIQPLLGRLNVEAGKIIWMALLLAILLALSRLSFRYIEQPLRKKTFNALVGKRPYRSAPARTG